MQKTISFFSFVLVFSLLLFPLVLAAQNPSSNGLPHTLTPEERELMPDYLQVFNMGSRAGILTPPNSPVRTPAEWEEAAAICITWTSYTEILREIVRHAREEVKVYIVCSDVTSVQNYLTAGGVDLSNVFYFVENYNSIWIRDYGQWCVYTNDVDSLMMVDWIYNRPRPADDVIPEVIAAFDEVPFYETTTAPYDLVATGGNFMTDGLGMGFSSELILQENPSHSKADIDDILGQFMGIDNYVMMPVLPYDLIHHIDMHMKLLDEETILMGEYPTGVSDGPQIESNLDYVLANFESSFGNPFKVVRMTMPPDGSDRYPSGGGDYRTFTNAIFINKTLLVPIYEEEYDTVALRIYEEQLPGYNVVGIDCNDIIPASGALHCITKLVMTDDPLLIAHPRLRDLYTEASQEVVAKVQHRSGIANAIAWYRTSAAGSFTPLPMSLTDPVNDTWTVTIPLQTYGTKVEYYIEANANSGKQQFRPITVPDGYYSYRVITVNTPPTANFAAPVTTICPNELVSFTDLSEAGISQWDWTFTGGIPANSTAQNPSVEYVVAGTYSVTLTVTNAAGTNSTTQNNIITVLSGDAPFMEDFSGGLSNTWQINNVSNDGVTWEWSNGIACGNEVMTINNFNNNNAGAQDQIYATFDLSNYSDAELTFDIAYRPYNTTQYFDRLQVTAQGCSGNKDIVFDKSSLDLSAVGSATDNEYTPNDCSDWQTEMIDLTPYVGGLVTVTFINITGYGNNLFLDNIDVGGTLISATPSVNVQAKLLLEGAYDNSTNLMTSDLASNNILPNIQPFNTAPWNYTGTETASTFPTDVVDWVLVEIRSATNNTQIVEQAAGFVTANGSLVDLDGNAWIPFYNLTQNEDYYVAIRQRNHIDVISANASSLPNATPLDFTDATNVLGGTTQLVEVAINTYALAAGDADGNGVISVADFNDYINESSQLNAYLPSDFDLNDSVTVGDFNVYMANASRIGVSLIRY